MSERAELQTEADELESKLIRLNTLIASDGFARIPGAKRALLREQQTHMRGYLAVLLKRIKIS